MAIVRNEVCTECRKNGHDSTGNHMMVFENGAKLCNHYQNHDSQHRIYLPPDGTDPILSSDIDGKINYTIEQFKQLQSDGKLTDDFTRTLAMSGMKMQNRYAVMTEEERSAIEKEWADDVRWFEGLSCKSLMDRGIHGLVAKLYNVRVGHDEKGAINRHYYPKYDLDTMEVVGAGARTIPKDFRFGSLGRNFGKLALAGVHTYKTVADSGQFAKKVMIVGGQCDMMAAQQMLIKQLNKLSTLQGVKTLDGLKLFHVWSVNKGEACIQELIDNKDELNRFDEIIFAFDNDEVGNQLNLEASKLFRGKAKFFQYPSGCKDANKCLDLGRDKEFVDAWFNPSEARVKGKLKSAGAYASSAKVMTKMGLPYWLDELNPVTFGIRLRFLAVWAAGTGVGKTDTTSLHVANLLRHKQPVVAIYLENTPEEVIKIFAGKLRGKDFLSPPWEASQGAYDESRDYTQADLEEAIDELVDSGLLFIPDLKGSKDIDVIMEVLEDAIALGYQYFVIDNLTAFEHKVDGKAKTGTIAIDESMKRLGSFKDENDVNIMLLTHCSRPYGERVPHEQGGEVYITDLRGAGSISFWANAVWSVERNTMADSIEDKCTTLWRNLKSRGVGYMSGTTVVAKKDLKSGTYSALKGVRNLPQVGRKKKDAAEQGASDILSRELASSSEEF